MLQDLYKRTHICYSLQEGEQFLTIPRDLMMTPQTASNSALGIHLYS